jgi:hypothetical protein
MTAMPVVEQVEGRRTGSGWTSSRIGGIPYSLVGEASMAFEQWAGRIQRRTRSGHQVRTSTSRVRASAGDGGIAADVGGTCTPAQGQAGIHSPWASWASEAAWRMGVDGMGEA